MKFISQVLYGLYRHYKINVSLIISNGFTVDETTGVITKNKISFNVYMINLPISLYIEYFQSGDAIEYDGIFILDTRVYVIDADNFENCYIVMDNVRYDIVKVEKYPQDYVYVFKTKANPGKNPENVTNISLDSRLNISQTVTN